MTKKIGYVNESVTRVELQHAVQSGVMWGSLGDGYVPIFEEQSTRLERGKSLEEWAKMDSLEKAMMIAIRRIDIAAKNLQAEAEIEKTKKETNRSRK